MKSQKRIGIIASLILGLVILIYATGYLLPARTHIERATYIDVSPEIAYGLMNDLGRFKDWAPWSGRDPEVQYAVDQPARGLGAALSWSSEDSSLGEGRLSIIDAQPYSKLRMLLELDGNAAVLAYQLEPLESGTHIVWTLDIEHGANPLSRYRGLLAKRRLNALLEPGLDHLRRLSERQPALPATDVVTQQLDYKVDGQSFTGFLAYDRNRGPSPGVLIVHEWWGHDDYVRKRAEQLAGLGYVALALDMYGGGKHAAHPDEAGRMAGEVKKNFETARARFMAALETLRDHPATDRERLAAIGYCFGGNIVLNMARAGIDLDGVVSFHGTLDAIAGPARQGQVKAGVLVLNGADDPMVPPEQVQAFMEEMDQAGVDYEFINYPGATHAFTNPEADNYAKQFNLPLAYNAAADQQSWQKMRDFFARIFR